MPALECIIAPMFDTSKTVKQALEFQKGAFTSWYDAGAAAQDQAVSAMDLMLDQAPWYPRKGVKHYRAG
jgi:hypothetical protein